MTQWTGKKRRDFLIEVMHTMWARYAYNPSGRGYITSTPFLLPPPGTQLNCEGAVHLMKDLAIDTSPPGALLPMHLQIVKVQAENRILFPWREDMTHALGSYPPSYVRGIGWIFENHFRLRDLADGNNLYDPIFCTVSPNNYDGIMGSRAARTWPEQFMVEEIFGEKYRVTTRGNERELAEMSEGPVLPKFSVDDGDFVE